MPVTPKTYQQIYDFIRSKVQARFPDADFVEGSFNNVTAGAWSLAYQELQALVIQEFAKTYLQNSQTTGSELERLAVDHFHEGAARPQTKKSVGAITITRDGNNEVIVIEEGQQFSSGELNFVSIEEVTILAGANTGTILVEAVEGGPAGNLEAGQEWSTSIDGVTVSNSDAFQGGADPLNDGEYREFIKNFIESLQDGTTQGLEGAAKIVSGVSDARVIRNLVDVGTLKADGTLRDAPVRFKSIILNLYVSGDNGLANPAILALVRNNVQKQLSAGEIINIQSSVPVSIDWDVTLDFSSTAEALALSSQRRRLEEAFMSAINDLSIGDDFIRADMATKVLTDNNWTNLFTVNTTKPAGDIVINNNQKAVAGRVTIEVT